MFWAFRKCSPITRQLANVYFCDSEKGTTCRFSEPEKPTEKLCVVGVPVRKHPIYNTLPTKRAQRQICLTQHVFKTSTAQTRKWLSYVNICKKHTLRMFHGVVWNHIPPQRIRTPVEVLVLGPVLTHLMLYGHRPKHSKCHTAFSLNPPKQTALYSVPANAQAWLHDM